MARHGTITSPRRPHRPPCGNPPCSVQNSGQTNGITRPTRGPARGAVLLSRPSAQLPRVVVGSPVKHATSQALLRFSPLPPPAPAHAEIVEKPRGQAERPAPPPCHNQISSMERIESGTRVRLPCIALRSPNTVRRRVLDHRHARLVKASGFLIVGSVSTRGYASRCVLYCIHRAREVMVRVTKLYCDACTSSPWSDRDVPMLQIHTDKWWDGHLDCQGSGRPSVFIFLW
ncbi:hypothetical protein BC628DRAFT_80697 [Trametes gibbosa]|nr:hypothetical protein BC628DRAFT_80697 [Trametes gibbosa]